MQCASIAENDNLKGAKLMNSSDRAGHGGAESGRKHHHSQRQRASDSVSPPPRSQSPPATPVKQFPHHHQQSTVYVSAQHRSAFSTSQPGSPTVAYKVSPITCENGNDVPTFNPQSPYRSMAPSISRFYDSSPNEPMHRNVGHDAAAASPPQFRRGVASSQSSASLHSQEGLHHCHAIASNDSVRSLGGNVSGAAADSAQTAAATTESGVTTVLTNSNAQQMANTPHCAQRYRGGLTFVATPEMPSSYSGKAVHGAVLTSPLTPPSGRLHFTAQRSSDGWSQQQQQQQQQSSSLMAPRGAPTSVPNVSAHAASTTASLGSVADSPIIFPRKQPENISPAVNGSLEGRVPASASNPSSEAGGSRPGYRRHQQQHPSGSPPPPQGAGVVASPSPLRESAVLTDASAHGASVGSGGNTRASESTRRWVSPQRPAHRGASADSSDEFQSPDSVPSSVDMPSTNASAPAPPRAPAMYGVISLPYARHDGATGSAAAANAGGLNGSGSDKAVVVSAATQFHAVPSSVSSSSSRAPTVIKLRSPPQQSQPQQQRQHAEQRGHSNASSNSSSHPPQHHDHHHHHHHPNAAAAGASGAAVTHIDPTFSSAGASGGAAAATAHPRSGSSEFSAQYRRSLARGMQSTGSSGGSCSNNNGKLNNTSNGVSARRDDDAYGAPAAAATIAVEHASGSPRTTPPLPPPPPQNCFSRSGSSNSGSGVDKGEGQETQQQQQRQNEEEQQQQHITSVAPATVVAARARAAAAAASVSEAVRRPERCSANTPMGTASSPAGVSAKHVPPLTADTVLPVAAQEEGPRFSSSTTDTTERSSSNSRLQLAAASPTSSKSSARTAATPLSSGHAKKLSHTASELSSNAVRQHRNSLKQPPQRQLPLSASYSGSGSPFATRATAVPTSPELNGRTSSGSARHRRSSASSNSASSAKPIATAMASYSFVSSRTHLQRYVDQWRDRFEEDKSAYKEGGYLTVTPGKIVHGRYVLIQKLGWGEFSTVWLAYDTKHATLGRGATPAFVAVKVAKCRSSVQEATHYEVSLLRYVEARLPSYAAVTNIIDCFDVQGEFGTHTCMVMPLCGPNLLSIIDRVKGQRGRRSADDVRLVKEIIISVLISLHELSVLNVVHTDIKPENVLCCAVDTKLVNSMEKFCSYNKDRSHMISTDEFRDAMAQQTNDHLVCLADFGLSALLEPPGSAATWAALCPSINPSVFAPLMRCKKNFNVTTPGVVDNLRGTLIQTREYRAPEVLLGLDFTCATDVWSVGCMAFELITGNFLMDPKKKTRDTREMDVEHLAMMMQLIGPLPADITDIRVRNNDYYEAVIEGTPVPRRTGRPPPEYLHRFIDKEGNFIYAARYRSYPRRSLEMELEQYLGFREAHLASNFILSCLCSYDPKNRPSAEKLLGHPWLQGVGTASKDKTGFR